MGATTCDYHFTVILLLAYALSQLCLPDVLEESWRIHHIQFIQKLWEVPLHFQDKLSVYFDCSLISHIFQLRSFHVNDHFYLINSFLIYEFFTISKFVSPGMFQFFNKEMDQHVNRLDYLHQFQVFDLTNLNNEYRSSFLVSRMKALRTQLLNLIKLLELVVKNLVNILLFAPLKIVSHLFYGQFLVKLMTLQKPSIETLIEK